MNKILNYTKSSIGMLSGIGATMVIVATLLVSASQAKAAEYPNITVAQNMTIGSTGQAVVVLQALMSELGYLNVPTGIPLGYYGSMTRDAVSRYQSSQNVYPTAGYFGPLTKVAMHDQFASRGWLSLLGW